MTANGSEDTRHVDCSVYLSLGENCTTCLLSLYRDNDEKPNVYKMQISYPLLDDVPSIIVYVDMNIGHENTIYSDIFGINNNAVLYKTINEMVELYNKDGYTNILFTN